MDKSWLRRSVTVPGVVLIALLLPLTSPVWMVLGTAIDLIRRRYRCPIVRLLIFATCWAWLETLGLLAAGILAIVGKSKNLELNYRIQEWWCRNVVASLSGVVGLAFEVEGTDTVGDGPYVLLARHVSLADAVMSSWVVGTLLQRHPRYVLKNELKMDPCLDVFGHRLPNYFVNRGSSNISSELDGIQEMGRHLLDRDVAVIFPEGSRANNKKRSQRLNELKTKASSRYEQLKDLHHLIPPKPAGALALLKSVPAAHVVTLTHSGLEGLDSFGAILRNFGQHIVKVRVRIQHFDRVSVPTDEAFVAWLDKQWIAMDHLVQTQISTSQLRG